VDAITFFVFLLCFLGWGLGGFFAKMAANKIGAQSIFWDIIGYVPAVLIYSLLIFKSKNLIANIHLNKDGIMLAILAGVTGSVGAITYYYLIAKQEASVIAPLTALYPALTILLAVVFLKEQLSLTKIIGVLLSLVAIYLLAK
jgi:transporter family protein